MWETLFWLLVAHSVADFGLQSEWMAIHKSRHAPPSSAMSSRPELIWIEVLNAHSLIHAGAVVLATGSLFLGVLEFIAHWIIDFAKSEDAFGFHTDQLLHIATKFVWLFLLWKGWA